MPILGSLHIIPKLGIRPMSILGCTPKADIALCPYLDIRLPQTPPQSPNKSFVVALNVLGKQRCFFGRHFECETPMSPIYKYFGCKTREVFSVLSQILANLKVIETDTLTQIQPQFTRKSHRIVTSCTEIDSCHIILILI